MVPYNLAFMESFIRIYSQMNVIEKLRLKFRIFNLYRVPGFFVGYIRVDILKKNVILIVITSNLFKYQALQTFFLIYAIAYIKIILTENKHNKSILNYFVFKTELVGRYKIMTIKSS